MKMTVMMLSILTPLIFSACWDKQEHSIAPPEHPYYRLSGVVSFEATGLALSGGEVSVQMTELYQGDFLDSLGSLTDQSGYYEIHDLYRGRYDIMVKLDSDTLYKAEVGIIKYEDKEFNVSIAPPDTAASE